VKVLLINSAYPEGCSPVWVPLGLLYIASFLEKNGVTVKVIDNAVLDYNEGRLVSMIKEEEPDIVGIGGMTVQANAAINIGKAIKKFNEKIKLVYGGVHFTFLPEEGLKYGDVVIIGEGEETFLKICRGQDLRCIKGICFVENDNIVKTEPREQKKDIDSLGFPAFHLVNMEVYNDFLISRERAISILTGRGCPYNCLFCASPQLYSRKVRYHSLDYVIDLIKYLKNTYDLKNLRIMDDTFILSQKRVLDFCDLIEPFKLNMTCLTHVGNGDYQMFRRMKEVGFSIIALGIESGNEDVLRLIGKNITKDAIRESVKMVQQAGLDTELLFMIGNIGETKKTIVESIKFAQELKSKYTWFQFATPFPGSQFFSLAPRYGKVLTYNYDLYHHQKPVFIPVGLDEKTMVYLREKALWVTRKRSFRDVLARYSGRIKARIPRKIKNYLKRLLK